MRILAVIAAIYESQSSRKEEAMPGFIIYTVINAWPTISRD